MVKRHALEWLWQTLGTSFVCRLGCGSTHRLDSRLQSSFRASEWAITLRSDPFVYGCSTGPNGLAVLAGVLEHLPRFQVGGRCELLLILKMLEVLMKKVPLRDLFLRQPWV